MTDSDPVFWSRPSHPLDPTTHEPLVDHLIAVETHAICNTPAYTTLSDGTPIRPILQTVAWMHDIGKLTTWWQRDHDNTTVPTISRPAGRVADHSFLGGVATWWTLDQLGYDPYLRLVAGIAVARHHNTLPKLSEYFTTRFTDADKWETARQQVDNIDTHATETARQVFNCVADRVTSAAGQTVNEISWEQFQMDLSEGYRSGVKQSVTQLTGQKLKRDYRSRAVYDDLLVLWGGLKAADSPASAGVQPAVDRMLPDPSHVSEYIEEELSPPDNPDTLSDRLDNKREQTRKQTLATLTDRLETIDTDTASGQIYTLTLPTGAGKTLTGTQTALHLHEATDSTGPLLYILPYTSIIDQTESVYADLFGFESDEPTPTVGVDHYLADSADEDDAEMDTEDTAGNMAVTPLWYNDITLSTTVQLWETLCGPSKSQVVKLPQLYESTIIIDEPQSLPTEWFGRVEELLKTLRDVFNTNVILMSATQPPISYPPESISAEAQELAPDVAFPDNTAVSIDQSVTSEALLDDTTVSETIAEDIASGTNSVLSIHNTINNTNRVSNALKTKLSDQGRQHKSLHAIYSDLIDDDLLGDSVHTDSHTDIDVYDTLPSVTAIVKAVSEADIDTLTVTLTTRHRPCDRSRILGALVALLSAQATDDDTRHSIPQIVALTTQLVEAGVDISFESLYRDIAPYESLIQAAGRCNREYEYGICNGDVTVWHLADNGDGPATPADYVYQTGGTNRLYHTAETLASLAGSNETITETDLINGYEQYKNNLAAKLSLSTLALDTVDGTTLTKASVIPDDGESVSVCIARTQMETNLIEVYRSAAEHDPQLHDRIRDTLSHIECSVRVDEETNITDIAHKIDDTLYIIDDEQAATVYSELGVTPTVDSNNSD